MNQSSNYGLLSQSQRQYRFRENDPNYKGDALDDRLANGPIERRQCTDIFFCFIFLLFWAGLLLISYQAFQTGDIARLAKPYDYDGNQCGVSKGFEDYKRIYFTNPNYMDEGANDGYYVCVSECPDGKKDINCKTIKEVSNCNGADVENYETIQFATICIPNNPKILQLLQKMFSKIGNIEEWLHDVKLTWPILLVSVLFAFVFGYVFLMLMKCCASIVVFAAILLYLGSLAVLGYFLFTKANQEEKLGLENEDNNAQKLKICAYVCWGVDLISLIILLCIYKQIKFAVTVMVTASNYIQDVCEALLVPIYMTIVAIFFFAYWITSTLYLYSSGTQTKSDYSPFAEVKWDTETRLKIYYQIVGLIWVLEFIIAFTQFVLAKSACLWYYSESNQIHNPISKSYSTAFAYHLGSFALGSLLLTLVKIIKICFEYLYEKFKETSQVSENLCIHFCLTCVHCCFDCFERFIRFITQNAYIQMALSGQTFCQSAYDSFYLMLRFPVRFGAVSGVGFIITELGKLVVSTSTAMCCYLIITKASFYNDNLYSPFIPTLFFFLIGYVISSFIISVYGITADAILYCYCVDEEIHLRLGFGGAKFAKNQLKQYFD